MIILMSADDPEMYEWARLYANHIGERFEIFGPDCFKDCKDTRITFIGHTDTLHGYGQGNYSKIEFARLIHDYRLPPTVRIVDIIGCRTGEMRNNFSFTHEVAGELYKKSEYRNLDFRTYTNLVSRNKVESMKVFLQAKQHLIRVEGMTPEAKEQFDKDVK